MKSNRKRIRELKKEISQIKEQRKKLDIFYSERNSNKYELELIDILDEKLEKINSLIPEFSYTIEKNTSYFDNKPYVVIKEDSIIQGEHNHFNSIFIYEHNEDQILDKLDSIINNINEYAKRVELFKEINKYLTISHCYLINGYFFAYDQKNNENEPTPITSKYWLMIKGKMNKNNKYTLTVEVENGISNRLRREPIETNLTTIYVHSAVKLVTEQYTHTIENIELAEVMHIIQNIMDNAPTNGNLNELTKYYDERI